MNVGIVGSRHFFDYAVLVDFCSQWVRKTDTIVSGGAPGVDALAERFAHEFTERAPLIFRPNPEEIRKYGFRVASYNRNGDIVYWGDRLLAMPCKCSTGTHQTVSMWRNHPKSVGNQPIMKEVKCGRL